MAKKENDIDNVDKPKIINDWLDILEDKETFFYMDENVRYVFVCDLIRHAALDEEEQFDKILKLDLSFEESFSLQQKYELDSYESEKQYLKDSSDTYENLMLLASINFSDKYAVKMLQRIIQNNKNEQVFNYMATPLIILNSTIRNLKQTLSQALSHECIKQADLIKTWFINEYQRCSHKTYPLLSQEKFISKILSSEIGLTNKNNNFQNAQQINVIKTLKDIVDINIEHLDIEKTQNIVSILYKIKAQSYSHTKAIKAIITSLMGQSLIEPDTLFDKTTDTFGQGVEIMKLFEFDNNNLEKVYEKRKQLLDEKLAPAKKVTIKRKI